MTEPLYQRDAYLAAFDAQVTGSSPTVSSSTGVRFFPGGGGQPPDTGDPRGRGAELPVTGSQRREGRVVLPGRRRVSRPSEPRSRLDWDRRHALMRTHTALHMLSGVIGRDYGALVTGATSRSRRPGWTSSCPR